MSQSVHIYAEQPGSSYAASWWEAVHVLYDHAFPGLPDGIRRAADIGLSWPNLTTPFARFDDDVCVSHVGVLIHPLCIDGHTTHAAGIHAVCTHSDHRRRGHARELLARAVKWADEHVSLAKLHTDDPPVYTSHGFREVPLHRFHPHQRPARNVTVRPLQPTTIAEDLQLLQHALRQRVPLSERLWSLDDRWLTLTDAALRRQLDSCFWLAPDHDFILALTPDDDGHRIADIIAPRPPDASLALGAAISATGPDLTWGVCTDLLDPRAAPEPVAERDGHFLIRGPLLTSQPLAISPLWEH